MTDPAIGVIDTKEANANGWHGGAFTIDPTSVREVLADLGESIHFPP